ncbi:S-layer family protein [Nostoc sp.]|uniref:S-layer family protein n=1 Tax=Nostoc sp. TaxID=1180 RepID=UPI002FF484D8
MIFADGNISIQATGSVFLKDSSVQAGRNLLVQASDSVSITRDNYSDISIKDNIYIPKANNISAEDVHIQARSVSLNNGSVISARRRDARERGLLTVKANHINLDQGWLDGDDIVLQVKDLILMRNFSAINIYNYNDKGGSIRIDASHGFFVASNNSDIDANVFYGNGGKITITATGIFGLNVPNRKDVISRFPAVIFEAFVNDGKPYNIYISSSMLPTNDVTAFSEQNPSASGIKTINILGISPRLVQLLPTNLVDTSQLLDTSCNPRSKQQASSFIISGRGGLPRNPYNFLSPNTVLVDWVTLNPSTRNRKSPPVTIKPTTATPKPIVEATGWVMNTKGELELTANAPSTPHGSWQNLVSCGAAS